MRWTIVKEKAGMAIVNDLQRRTLEKFTRNTEAKCTYSIVTDSEGTKLLQLDTYGSDSRKLQDKASQSIRFSERALQELKRILREHFP